MTEDEIKRGRHLGDGVYASFDGFHIVLSLYHHNNTAVALEPRVFSGLVQYKDELEQYYGKKFI